MGERNRCQLCSTDADTLFFAANMEPRGCTACLTAFRRHPDQVADVEAAAARAVLDRAALELICDEAGQVGDRRTVHLAAALLSAEQEWDRGNARFMVLARHARDFAREVICDRVFEGETVKAAAALVVMVDEMLGERAPNAKIHSLNYEGGVFELRSPSHWGMAMLAIALGQELARPDAPDVDDDGRDPAGNHEQNIGRVHRDGQGQSVAAYYLLADAGSDPIVADVLGVKRAQIEGVRNPNLDLIEKLDASGDRIRELAKQYLAGTKAA